MSVKRADLLVCLVIAVAVIAIYGQVEGFEFVRFDDKVYALNPHARAGISVESLRWALLSRDDVNWMPVTRLSHILDNTLFGPRSGPAHLVSALIHLAASLMVFWFLVRATGAFWESAFSAMLFAVHPLHVESVAWVAERKDVLCAFFWFLALWAWAGYTANPTRGRYWRTLLLVSLGMMSKPMMVTFPVVMLLLDWWPLGRPISRKILIEKIPFAALAGITALIAFQAQRSGGAVVSFEALGRGLRIENALETWVIYPIKTVWPDRLAVWYPYPESIAPWVAILCGACLAGISTLAIVLRRRTPYLLTGWFWYLVTTLPVIGLIQVGMQARADRYMYIPMVGLAIVVAWGVRDLIRRWPGVLRVTAPVAAGVALLAFAGAAWSQAGYWRNSELLFRRAIDVTDGNYVAHQNLASELTHAPGRLDEGIAEFEEELRIRPGSAEAHGSLCGALTNAGRLQEALRECDAALKIDPNSWEALNNRGGVLAALGRPEEAMASYQEAIRIRPAGVEPHTNRGGLLLAAGRLQEALAEDDAALAIDPNLVSAHYQKGAVLLQMGNPRTAADELETALQGNPNHAGAHDKLGEALTQLPGGVFEAMGEFQKAVQLNPNLASARGHLALALSGAGRHEEALAQIQAAMRIEPGTKWADVQAQVAANARPH